MKRLFFGIAFLLGASILASVAETRFASGPQQTALIELYTSEGCSSCPPAEAWMGRLKGEPDLWKNFVPIAFHVDYWDNLGWRDRFSSPLWSERQRRYGSLWQSDSIYTPAVVRDGNEVRNWSGRAAIQPNEKKPGVLTVRTADGLTFAIDFGPEDRAATNWEAHVALLGSGISSKIGAGENSGRNLEHDFVVLDLHGAEMKAGAGVQHASVTMKEPAEAGRKGVAIWITSQGKLASVQATGGWLP